MRRDMVLSLRDKACDKLRHRKHAAAYCPVQDGCAGCMKERPAMYVGLLATCRNTEAL